MVGRVFLAAVLAAGLAAAQGGKGGGGMGGSGMGGSGMGGAGMPRPQQQSKMEQLAEKLKLNKDQKEEAAKILSAALETAGTLNQQIATGRRMIAEAMVNGKDSGDDYTKLLNAYTDVLAQMDGLEATSYAKIYALLKPNQQKNADQAFTETMAGIFVRTGGGGGGRKRGQ